MTTPAAPIDPTNGLVLVGCAMYALGILTAVVASWLGGGRPPRDIEAGDRGRG